MLRIIAVLLLCFSTAEPAQIQPCTATDTASIQATLDACAGQTVHIAPGTYSDVDPLFVAAGTTLEVQAGATLVATENPAAYARPDGENNGLYALINAANASNVSLTGEGTIDGNGASWWARTRAAQQAGTPDPPRPRLVAFDDCTHARIVGVTLTNSPSFHIVLRRCTDVDVDSVTIIAPADSPNTDGVDPMSSQDVRILNSTIDSGDDNIAVKASPGSSSGIDVENCTFLHGHGVSIGSETTGGVSHMVVSNSTFQDTQNGIRIKTNRRLGGPISNITYSNLAMDGVQQPIAFADYYPDVPATGDESTEAVGQTTPRVSDVRVSNLQASRARSAGWIVGLPEAPMYNIVLQDVTVEAFTGLTVRHAAVTMTRTRIDVVNGPEVL
ncbi:MAG: right-handed parallel beta-helix repeat-containing protein, partial [Chloroflexi bacterium]|nr:right-handed parallel beta-helix repeat-containing protein [Chloroflexota bacterium]